MVAEAPHNVHGHRSRIVLKGCHVGRRELAERYKKTEYFSDCEVTDESRSSTLVLTRIIGGLGVTAEERREKALGLIKGDLGDIDISLLLPPLWFDKSLLKITSG